ncbi:hypothetical protein HMI56_006846 [Coelomomyces lativittatus]|nr:hypothetical protein HMI56_006846 [Coelomomyces lativittatus]
MVHCTVNYINSLSAVLPTLQAFLQRLPSMEYQEHCAMLLEWLEIYFNHIETTKKKKEPIPMFEVNSTSIEHGSMQFFDHALDHSLHTMKTMLQKNELSVDTLQSFLFNHFVHPTTLALKHWQQLRSCLNYIYWINSFSDGEHCKLLHLAFKLPSFENILGPIKEYFQFQLIVYVSCMNIKFSTLVDENEGTNGGHETKLRCIWFEKAVAAYLGFLNHTFDDVKGHDINLHLLFKELMNTWLELELSLCVRTLEQLLKILIQTKEYALLITFIFWVDKNHPFLKYATWEEWAALIIYEKCPSTVQLTVAQCVLQAYIKDIDAEKALHFNTRIALWFRVVIKSALVRNEKVALDFLQQLPELLEIIQFPETEVIWLIQVAWNTALDFTSLSNLEALKWGEIAIQIARVLQYEHLKMMQDQFRTMKLELEQDT